MARIMDYSFKEDEMNGGDLICNIHWLGKFWETYDIGKG